MDNPIQIESIIKYLQIHFPNFIIKPLNIDLPYLIAGDFARYLLKCYKDSKNDELNKGLNYIEDLHLFGSKEVKELATIGFLEGIQNISSNSNVNPEVIFDKLGIESKKWWHQLNKFWKNQIKYVGETINSE